MTTSAVAAADRFRAISDRSRRSILDMLIEGEKPVRVLLQAFDFSQPALSKHLRVLREAGLVSSRKVGREHHYRVEGTQLQEVAVWVARYQHFWTERFDRLGDFLDEED